ncbi:hypothetical protein JYA63_02290 [Fictibacillus nanhaiensis]|uniref:Transposase n=1 Tax=Fictibacillus nanhaiensis TaxID=742169 RepID=A0ABS2ZLR1_9BACL|nr:hypothetical protein [Fictibacillus nanhaiensis]
MKRSNVAHRLPRGKRTSGTEINYFQKQQRLRKQPNKKALQVTQHHFAGLST